MGSGQNKALVLACECLQMVISYYRKENNTMANTTAVYARIDTNLKDNAEGILSQLGITPSSAIQMLYSQIVLLRGLPFQLRLPETKVFSAEGLDRAEFDYELKKGVDSIKAGRIHSTEDVDNMLAEEFGI